MRATHKRLGLLSILLGLAAFAVPGCATTLASSKWRLPDTPAARACFDDCHETRRLCDGRLQMPETGANRLSPVSSIEKPVSADRVRSERCSESYERCVGACPGAVSR